MRGDVQLWFHHLAPESITRYDMFTDLLIDKWGRNTNNSLECKSSNDCAVDNQYIDNLLSQLDHSSPEMFQIMSVFLQSIRMLHSSQYSSYLNLDSDFDYVSAEEEKVEINQISVEEQSCGHIVVEDQVCEDDKEVINEHIVVQDKAPL